MKKHKQHLIDHNTLESTAPKVDSSTAAMDRHATASAVSRDDKAQQSLRGSEATEAIHNEKADSSAKVDRHADKSARDDRENADSSTATPQDSTPTPTTQPPQDSSPTTTKAVAPTLTPSPQDSRICDEKVGLCSGEQGDKTRASIDEASHKLPALSRKAESTTTLCACSEFVYLGSLPYTLRLPTGKTYPLHQGDSFIVPQGDLSRYLEYKSTMFKKLR